MADLRETENNEKLVQKVVKFMYNGCGCTLGGAGGSCSNSFQTRAYFLI